MREVIKIAFRRENINVITCHDPGSALTLMNQTVPDVVISDVIMPEKDGYEVCQYIKQHPALAKTPVILMSGVVNRSVAERAFAVKADELIRKPFQPQDLINRVRHLLHGKSASRPAAPPPASVATMATLSSIFQTLPATRPHSRPSLAVVPRLPAAEAAFPPAGVIPSAVAVGESAAAPALATPASAKTALAGELGGREISFLEEPLAELCSPIAGETQSPVADLGPARATAAFSSNPVSTPTDASAAPAGGPAVTPASAPVALPGDRGEASGAAAERAAAASAATAPSGGPAAETQPSAQPDTADRKPRVPAPPALQPAKTRLEILRLQSQIKKLQAELAAEREYVHALEEHIKTLQEVE
jgi:CheY-like chemotaxis protein